MTFNSKLIPGDQWKIEKHKRLKINPLVLNDGNNEALFNIREQWQLYNQESLEEVPSCTKHYKFYLQLFSVCFDFSNRTDTSANGSLDEIIVRNSVVEQSLYEPSLIVGVSQYRR